MDGSGRRRLPLRRVAPSPRPQPSRARAPGWDPEGERGVSDPGYGRGGMAVPGLFSNRAGPNRTTLPTQNCFQSGPDGSSRNGTRNGPFRENRTGPKAIYNPEAKMIPSPTC
jgi:hypothetical protein